MHVISVSASPQEYTQYDSADLKCYFYCSYIISESFLLLCTHGHSSSNIAAEEIIHLFCANLLNHYSVQGRGFIPHTQHTFVKRIYVFDVEINLWEEMNRFLKT